MGKYIMNYTLKKKTKSKGRKCMYYFYNQLRGANPYIKPFLSETIARTSSKMNQAMESLQQIGKAVHDMYK